MTEFPLMTAAQAKVTNSFLTNLAEQRSDQTSQLQILSARAFLACHIPFDLDLEDVAAKTEVFSAQLLVDQSANTLSLDPLPLIILHRILHKAGQSIPSLTAITGRISDELIRQPATILALAHPRLISAQLARLGYKVNIPPATAHVTKIMKSADCWLNLSADELSEFIDHLQMVDTNISEDGFHILGLIALAELRNYRIDLGCKILRTLIRRKILSIEVQEAVTYIALQRRRNGSYGFINPFHNIGLECDGSDPAANFHLPITLNVLWLFHDANWKQPQTSSNQSLEVQVK